MPVERITPFVEEEYTVIGRAHHCDREFYVTGNLESALTIASIALKAVDCGCCVPVVKDRDEKRVLDWDPYAEKWVGPLADHEILQT